MPHRDHLSAPLERIEIARAFCGDDVEAVARRLKLDPWVVRKAFDVLDVRAEAPRRPPTKESKR